MNARSGEPSVAGAQSTCSVDSPATLVMNRRCEKLTWLPCGCLTQPQPWLQPPGVLDQILAPPRLVLVQVTRPLWSRVHWLSKWGALTPSAPYTFLGCTHLLSLLLCQKSNKYMSPAPKEIPFLSPACFPATTSLLPSGGFCWLGKSPGPGDVDLTLLLVS